MEREKAFLNRRVQKGLVTPVVADARALLRELNNPFRVGRLLKKPPHPIPIQGNNKMRRDLS